MLLKWSPSWCAALEKPVLRCASSWQCAHVAVTRENNETPPVPKYCPLLAVWMKKEFHVLQWEYQQVCAMMRGTPLCPWAQVRWGFLEWLFCYRSAEPYRCPGRGGFGCKPWVSLAQPSSLAACLASCMWPFSLQTTLSLGLLREMLSRLGMRPWLAWKPDESLFQYPLCTLPLPLWVLLWLRFLHWSLAKGLPRGNSAGLM